MGLGVNEEEYLICGLKVAKGLDGGITQLYAKLCKMTIWLQQTDYLKINLSNDKKEEDAENTETSEKIIEEENFYEIVCAPNTYVVGLGDQYQHSESGTIP